MVNGGTNMSQSETVSAAVTRAAEAASSWMSTTRYIDADLHTKQGSGACDQSRLPLPYATLPVPPERAASACACHETHTQADVRARACTHSLGCHSSLVGCGAPAKRLEDEQNLDAV